MPRRPNPRKQSKNARRITAAESALNRVQPLRQNKIRKQKQQSTRENMFTRYCRGILEDSPESGCEIPSFGYTGRYSTVMLTTRTSLTTGAGNNASCVVNPYLALVGNLHIERYIAGVQQFNFIPACFTNGLTTNTGSLPDHVAGHYSQLLFNGGYVATENVRYTGQVRPRWIHFKLIYTGTELNKGGQIQFFHNPAQRSMISYVDAAANTAAFDPSFTTVSSMTADTENCITHVIGDGIEFTWRPQSYEFKSIDTYIETAAGSANTLNATVMALGYAPEVDTPNVSAPLGWTTGFQLLPAAGYAAGVQIPYELEITMEVDAVLSSSSGTTNPVAAFPGTKQALSHPNAEALLKNVTSRLHSARSQRIVPHNAKKCGLLKEAASSALTGMATALGESVMSKLPAAFG